MIIPHVWAMFPCHAVVVAHAVSLFVVRMSLPMSVMHVRLCARQVPYCAAGA